MRNNESFKVSEIFLFVILMILISSFSIYFIVKGQKNAENISFKKDVNRFYHVVSSNLTSFHDNNIVYLQEVIDEEFLKEIKSPFEKNSRCDSTESKVEYIDQNPFVSLRCGEYFIEKYDVKEAKDISIYKVSDWSLEKPKKDSFEEKSLYNCVLDDKEIFSKYYEEFYLVYLINQKYHKNYYSIGEVESNVCRIVKKDFYRIKEIVKE